MVIKSVTYSFDSDRTANRFAAALREQGAYDVEVYSLLREWTTVAIPKDCEALADEIYADGF